MGRFGGLAVILVALPLAMAASASLLVPLEAELLLENPAKISGVLTVSTDGSRNLVHARPLETGRAQDRLVESEEATLVLHRWVEPTLASVGPPGLIVTDCHDCYSNTSWSASGLTINLVNVHHDAELILRDPQGSASTPEWPAVEVSAAVCLLENRGTQEPVIFPQNPNNVMPSPMRWDTSGANELTADCHADQGRVESPRTMALYGYELLLNSAEEKDRLVLTGTFEEEIAGPNFGVTLDRRLDALPGPPVPKRTVTQILEVQYDDHRLLVELPKSRVELYAPNFLSAGELRVGAARGYLNWGTESLQGELLPWRAHGTFGFDGQPERRVAVSGLTLEGPAVSVKTVVGTVSPVATADLEAPPTGSPVVFVDAIDAVASEDGDPASLSFHRWDGELASALDIAYATSGTAGLADHNLRGSLISFPPGASTVTVSVMAVDDQLDEADETLIVSLISVENYMRGDTVSVSLQIIDNDLPAVGITATDPVVSAYTLPTVTLAVVESQAPEDGSDVAAILVGRSDEDVLQPLDVAYEASGTATPGADYESLPGTITIPAGEREAVLFIRPQRDSEDEAGETIIVGLRASEAYLVGADGAGLVTIVNQSNGSVALLVVAVAASVGALGFLARFFWLLFSKLARDRMLEHPRRSRIYELVCEQPGIQMNTVARTMGIPWTKTAHHVGKLQLGGQVVLKKVGGRTALFPANKGYLGREEQVVLLRRDTPRRIVQTLEEKPGLSQSALAETLGVTRARISQALKSMVNAGLVAKERREGLALYRCLIVKDRSPMASTTTRLAPDPEFQAKSTQFP